MDEQQCDAGTANPSCTRDACSMEPPVCDSLHDDEEGGGAREEVAPASAEVEVPESSHENCSTPLQKRHQYSIKTLRRVKWRTLKLRRTVSTERTTAVEQPDSVGRSTLGEDRSLTVPVGSNGHKNSVTEWEQAKLGSGKVAQMSKKVAPEPSVNEQEQREEKSLISAVEVIPLNRMVKAKFDIVAVSFWLAELQGGYYLFKLRYPGDKHGKRRKYTVVVDKFGSVTLQWKSMDLLGSNLHKVELVSTEICDAAAREFRMDTTAGEVFARAASSEAFELWTEGMAHIFSYAHAFAQKRRAELRKFGY